MSCICCLRNFKHSIYNIDLLNTDKYIFITIIICQFHVQTTKACLDHLFVPFQRNHLNMKMTSYVVNHQYLREQRSRSWVSTPTRTLLRPMLLRTSWQSQRKCCQRMLIPRRGTNNRWTTLVSSPNSLRRRWEEWCDVEFHVSVALVFHAYLLQK